MKTGKKGVGGIGLCVLVSLLVSLMPGSVITSQAVVNPEYWEIPGDLYAEWDEYYASWSEDDKAYKYEVRLYLDGNNVYTAKTEETELNMKSHMAQAGSYKFRVRGLGRDGEGPWSNYSDVIKIKSSNNNNNNNNNNNPVRPSGWVMESNGKWWWRNADGTYPVSAWQMINNHWYFFGADGYMFTGWLDYNGGKYYCQPTGEMAVGWISIGDKWYYFDSSMGVNYGKMKVNTQVDGYQLGKDGVFTG